MPYLTRSETSSKNEFQERVPGAESAVASLTHTAPTDFLASELFIFLAHTHGLPYVPFLECERLTPRLL